MTTAAPVIAHPPTERPVTITPPRRTLRQYRWVLILILSIVSLLVALFVWDPRMRPVPASKLDAERFPFGRTGDQAWANPDGQARGGTSLGFKVPDTESISTFVRHPSLEPDWVLCVLDLNYAAGATGPFPIKPLKLALVLGRPYCNGFGMVIHQPLSLTPYGIVLTGAAADEFMKNGPTQEQIDELIAKTKK